MENRYSKITLILAVVLFICSIFFWVYLMDSYFKYQYDVQIQDETIEVERASMRKDMLLKIPLTSNTWKKTIKRN